MILDELTAIWTAEASAQTRDAYEGRRIQSSAPLEAYAGLDQAGRLRFVAVRLESTQRKSIGDRYPRSSRGIAVESREGGGGKLAIFLREQPGTPPTVFPSVMEDVLRAAVEAPAERGLRAFLERFASWQLALSRQAGLMSAQEVRGILGELVVFRDVLAPAVGLGRALQVWRAPADDHIHDFVGVGWELEVKTALAPARTFHVNAAGQLEAEGDNEMFLVGVELESSAEGTSLRQAIEQLLAAVESSDAKEDLRNAFVARGAMSHTLDDEAARPYRLGTVSLYSVGPKFPMIRAASLPGGVGELRYEVSLAACSEFLITQRELSSHLKKMEPVL